jgi:hypothetical protein
LPGLVRIRFKYTGFRDTAINVLWAHCTAPGPYAAADLLTVATNLHTAWADVWKTLASTSTALEATDVTDFTSATGLSSEYVDVVAGIQPDMTAAQAAMVISLQTSERYRGGHGRCYIPGLAFNHMADSHTWDNTAVSTIGDFWADWIVLLAAQALGAGTLAPVVVRNRRVLGEAYIKLIGALIAQPVMATQRRRARKVAHH